jgi:hypothetical protein
VKENKNKTNKKTEPAKKYKVKVGIKGSFEDVFIVIKKHKEMNTKKP